MKSAIDMQSVTSSQLDSVGHDAETNKLAIRFKGKGAARGSLYHYSNVSASDFDALVSAESVGSHFKQHIKADPEKYPYELINENEPPATLG